MKKSLLGLAAALCAMVATAQVSTTALDAVPPFNYPLYFGTNLGYHGGAWPDARLADIAAGNPALGVPGVGARSLRLFLPEYFLEGWGYGVELADFGHYHSVGMRELTVLLQGPKPEHSLGTQFCAETNTQLFSNLYLPIWDGGANGTPYHDDNHYARYVYETAQRYGGQVRFWEIINEPDYTPTGNGWQPRGAAGNWFDAPPNPCDLKNLRAPVYYYIRTLRIAYEVIKSLHPDAYVTVGGLGYPSFLDALLRYTDNPADGSPTAEYPLGGGAYFDAVAYHSYPSNDGSMRHYDFDAHAFAYYRHSDAAVAGVIGLKNRLEAVLTDRGFGTNYPAKRWIVTECNVGRAPFNQQMGSVEGQRNFAIKVLVGAAQNGIDQFHTYALADKKTTAQATNPWDLMGFYYNITTQGPYQQQVAPNGVAFKTAADLLHRYRHDAALNEQLALPAHIGGGAFRSGQDSLLFVLWAKTATDQSEVAAAGYSFPPALGITTLERRNWDYSQTGQTFPSGSMELALTGAPVFLLVNRNPNPTTTATTAVTTADWTATLHPNPAQGGGTQYLTVSLPQAADVSAALYTAAGQRLNAGLAQQLLPAGTHTLALDMADVPPGTYIWRVAVGGEERVLRGVRM